MRTSVLAVWNHGSVFAILSPVSISVRTDPQNFLSDFPLDWTQFRNRVMRGTILFPNLHSTNHTRKEVKYLAKAYPAYMVVFKITIFYQSTCLPVHLAADS